MDFLRNARLALVASTVALAVPGYGSAADPGSGDFINLNGVASASTPAPVYGPVPAPWDDARFRTEFPDVGFLPEARVDLIARVETDPGSGAVSGAHHAKAIGPSGIHAPKLAVKRQPGF